MRKSRDVRRSLCVLLVLTIFMLPIIPQNVSLPRSQPQVAVAEQSLPTLPKPQPWNDFFSSIAKWLSSVTGHAWHELQHSVIVAQPTLRPVYALPPPSIQRVSPFPGVVNFSESSDHVTLDLVGSKLDFYKGSAGYNVVRGQDGSLAVANDQIFLEYQQGNNWKQIGVPQNLTWTQVSSSEYKVTRNYSDFLGTIYSVTYDVRWDGTVKITMNLTLAQSQTYRVHWAESGIVYSTSNPDYATSNQLIFSNQDASGNIIGAEWISYSWLDVQQSFGSITGVTLSTGSQGRKADIAFTLGALAAQSQVTVDPITRVQGNAKGTANSGTTITVTMGSTPTSGNVIIIAIGVGSSSITVSSISETNVTWSGGINGRQVQKTGSNANTVEIWFGSVGASASTTITVTMSGSMSVSARGVADACEYSGLATASVLDKTATNTGTSSNPTTGTTATTTQASELWVGAIHLTDSGVGPTSVNQSSPTNGFTLLDGVGQGTLATTVDSLAYLENIVSATGTASSGTTAAGSGWASGIATFKAATITQPVTLTLAETGGVTATFTASGCGVNPTTVAGDGVSHNLQATPSCSLTITVPADGSTSRYRFPAGATTWSFNTCASGTCSAQTNIYHYQLQATFADSGIGTDTSVTIVTVNGTAYVHSSLPVAQWWDYNSQATYAYGSPIASSTTGKRYGWSSTSGLSQTAQSNTFSVTTGGTVTGTYLAQFNLKIQAADKAFMSNILGTTKAAMNVTVNAGSTTILLADANGYMDFGWLSSGTQVYLTAKYSGTVVNSTWHTTLYTINSVSVYQWVFEYNAYVTVNAFSAPSGQATDSTKWNFTSYYVTTNSSATISSGTVKVYYQTTSYQVCSVTITSPSFTVCTATQSLAGPHDPTSTASVYVNMTDGFVWIRSSTTQTYGVTDTGFIFNPPVSWTTGNGVGVTWSYTNTASAGATKLIVTNSLIQISLLNPNSNGYLYNTTGSYFNATANSFQSGVLTVNIPGSFSGAYELRLLLMQKLMNGTVLILDHVDTIVSVTSTPSGGGFSNFTPVPQWLSLRVDLVEFPPVKVNQTRSVDLVLPVKITGTPSSITITKITLNYPWVTVTDQLPIYLTNVNKFTIHLHIAPGRDVAVGVYPDVQPVFEGFADQSVLWQNVQFIVEVYPSQAPPVRPPQFPVLETVSLAVTIGSGAYAIITRFRKAVEADSDRSIAFGVFPAFHLG